MSGRELEHIDIEELIPYARNSRTHSDEQIAQVAASIKEFGFTNPVLIDDENGIIAGHGRTLAARKLKLDKIPCIRLSGLSDTQKKAYIIADNKLALNAGWDNEMLALEIEELQDLDFDIELLGFDEEELDIILEDEDDSAWDKDAKNELGLSDRFLVPPFSIIRGDLGDWRNKSTEWKNIGIDSGGGGEMQVFKNQ